MLIHPPVDGLMLFLVWGYYEKICYKYLCSNFSGYVFLFLLSKYQDWNFCIIVLMILKNSFPKSLKLFTMTPLMQESSSCSTSLIKLDIASLINFSHLGGFIVVSHCGFLMNLPYSSWNHMDLLHSPCCTSVESPQDSVSLFQKQ